MRPIHAQVSHRMTTCNCKDMRRHHQSNAALHFTRPNRGLLYSSSSAASRDCARRCAHTSKNHLYSRILTADLIMISWPMIPKAEALHGYRYQCWKNCWYNFLRKMKTNWEVEMNQYTESQPNRGAIQRNNETLEAKTVLCMGCLACLEGWLGCLEKRTTRRKWKDSTNTEDVLENLST